MGGHEFRQLFVRKFRAVLVIPYWAFCRLIQAGNLFRDQPAPSRMGMPYQLCHIKSSVLSGPLFAPKLFVCHRFLKDMFRILKKTPLIGRQDAYPAPAL
jgi:hypothetical protein